MGCAAIDHMLDSFLHFAESIRQALVSSGAVANMVDSLSFQDSAVQASTVQAIGMLAGDQVGRQQAGPVG